ncbi:MAG: hypothetical protein EZS28_032477 [Streblomastix strix]|uniref:HECT-type E3 ubiquitin transferase n=1 Tax=Streblomastix strix TaxID=222440 RepID=A0A5J4UMT6_9EUKA|nr:MAG: hypothetical protein EZS28_032477 [Streblomastix strix]
MTAVPKYSEELKLTFEITVEEEGKDQTGEQLTFELKENGRNIDLSAENHVDFIELYSKRKIFGSEKAQKQRAALFQGFRESIPYEYLFSDHTFVYQSEDQENNINKVDHQMIHQYKEIITPTQLTPSEVDDIVCGELNIDVSDWERNTHHQGIEGQQNINLITWFWEIVNSMTDEQRRDLLQFGTGARNVPIRGFSRLSQIAGRKSFTIRWKSCIDQRLINIIHWLTRECMKEIHEFRILNEAERNLHEMLNQRQQQRMEIFDNYENRIDQYINVLRIEAGRYESIIKSFGEKQGKTDEEDSQLDTYVSLNGLCNY